MWIHLKHLSHHLQIVCHVRYLTDCKKLRITELPGTARTETHTYERDLNNDHSVGWNADCRYISLSLTPRAAFKNYFTLLKIKIGIVPHSYILINGISPSHKTPTFINLELPEGESESHYSGRTSFMQASETDKTSNNTLEHKNFTADRLIIMSDCRVSNWFRNRTVYPLPLKVQCVLRVS